MELLNKGMTQLPSSRLFYFTLCDDLDYLDGKHTVFGEVAEGIDTLTRINEAYVDEKGRPYKNIRSDFILTSEFLVDLLMDMRAREQGKAQSLIGVGSEQETKTLIKNVIRIDPPQLAELIPERSPEGKPPDEIIDVRLEDDWVPMDETLGPAELEEALRAKEAESNAVFLETVGDIPDAEIRPPENVLFVCKLNPVTQDEDLDTIFSRFGTVLSAEVIRDYKTGDSLCYAFIDIALAELNPFVSRLHFGKAVILLLFNLGRGCFKCGALDHIARDCPEGSKMNNQNPKYILKDDNTQRGGNGHQRYEMVFEGDTSPNMDHKKAHHVCEMEDVKKLKRECNQSSDDIGRRDHRKRDYGDDGERYDNRKRDHERSHRRDYEHNERKYSGERYKGEEVQEREITHRQRQDKQDQRKRSDSDYGVPSKSEDQGRRMKDDRASVHAKSGREDDRSMDREVDRGSRHKRRDIDIDGDHSNRHKRRDINSDGEHQREHTERSPKGVNHHKRSGDRNRETDSSRRERDGDRKRERDSSHRERDGGRQRVTDNYSKADRKHEKERR
ncbi:hypothetical protein ACLOJK_021555 [Asimina triloba]